jgi:hypothetical protein
MDFDHGWKRDQVNKNPAYLQGRNKRLIFNKTVSEIFINLKELIDPW